MPNDTDAPVAAFRGGPFGTGHRFLDCVILVVAGQNLEDFLAIGLEQDKVLDDVEKMPLVKHALDQHFQLWQRSRGNSHAIDGPPGHEPVFIGCQRSCFGIHSVADHQK